MKTHTITKITAALMLGVLIGIVIHHDHIRRGQLGRKAFLAKQSVRFDRYFSKPRSIGFEIFGGVIMASCIVGTYELMAFGCRKLLSKVDDDTA